MISFVIYLLFIQNVCHVHGDPCPGENNLCQVGFTDKGYRCKCREGYEYARNDCQGKIQQPTPITNGISKYMSLKKC